MIALLVCSLHYCPPAIRPLRVPNNPKAEVAAPRANVPAMVARYINMLALAAGMGLLQVFNVGVIFQILLYLVA